MALQLVIMLSSDPKWTTLRTKVPLARLSYDNAQVLLVMCAILQISGVSDFASNDALIC